MTQEKPQRRTEVRPEKRRSNQHETGGKTLVD